MAPRELTIGYKRAGGDYLTALQKLGLDPDCLFWAYDEVVNGHVLVLVSSIVDYAGPLDLSRLLFRAYNLAVTPKEIDPFVLRLHSPDQAFIRELRKVVDWGIRIEGPDSKTSSAPPFFDIKYEVGGMSLGPEWIYKFLPQKHSTVDLSRQWRRLNRNLDRLAA